jgi:hypothetical protein
MADIQPQVAPEPPIGKQELRQDAAHPLFEEARILDGDRPDNPRAFSESNGARAKTSAGNEGRQLKRRFTSAGAGDAGPTVCHSFFHQSAVRLQCIGFAPVRSAVVLY